VLLAEDHEINRMLVTQMLVRRGFQVHGVADGQEVLDALQTDDFDVILMDCQMPHLDGFAATRAIRLQESASGEYIPIIAITAHAMAGFREKCLAEGMDDYICKPFQPEELARTILTIAHKRRRIGAAKDTDREL
jgi:CheY-like chemotaxis protein